MYFKIFVFQWRQFRNKWEGKKKRQKLVKWNAKKAFKKEEKLFDVEKNIKTRYSHDTILGMHSFNEADDVSKFL